MTRTATDPPRLSRVHARLVALVVFAGCLALTGCSAGEFHHGLVFWGDHAEAAIRGDDPSRD